VGATGGRRGRLLKPTAAQSREEGDERQTGLAIAIDAAVLAVEPTVDERTDTHRRRSRSHWARLWHAALVLALVGAVVALLTREPRGDPVLRTASGTAIAYPASYPPIPADPAHPGVVIAQPNGMDFPDPFLLAWGGQYYLYISSSLGSPVWMNVPMMRAPEPQSVPLGYQTGLGRWGPVTDALPTVPAWAVPRSSGLPTWSPNVNRIDGRFVMYMAPVVRNMLRTTHCLGIATATSPSGPFVPVPGPPIVCQLALGGDIDPYVFVDPHGPRGPHHPYYLVWKSDNNNLPGSGLDMIWAAPLSDNGLSLAGPAVRIFSADEAWEQPILEAPQMVAAPDGSDWMLFSSGTGYLTFGSALGIAECAGPLGGCHDVRTSPLIASNAQGAGPGEETVFVSPQSGVWILYSPWRFGDYWAWERPVEAARLGWTSRGPVLLAPGSGPLAAS
jgi:hypothetical protein